MLAQLCFGQRSLDRPDEHSITPHEPRRRAVGGPLTDRPPRGGVEQVDAIQKRGHGSHQIVVPHRRFTHSEQPHEFVVG